MAFLLVRDCEHTRGLRPENLSDRSQCHCQYEITPNMLGLLPGERDNSNACLIEEIHRQSYNE